MYQTFVNLPASITSAIASILAQPENSQWMDRAEKLHTRYLQREKNTDFIQDSSDVSAYLGLRIPATYAQIYSALSQVQEIFPTWEPKSVLDLGSGSGTGVWAAKTLWPNLSTAVCIDQEKYFLSAGKEIVQKSALPINIFWEQQDITDDLEKNKSTLYDLIIIANVLNELPLTKQEKFLSRVYENCRGIMVIIEPGTPFGFQIVQAAAKTFSSHSTLMAPYIDNTFIESNEYWIHFAQRFIRPEFLRQFRQYMRQSTLMASDWEEAKYAYVAVGKIEPEKKIWGRCVGLITKQKGFLELPVLTKEGIKNVKILKRHKKEYAFAKELHWGQTIASSKNLSL